MPEPRRGIDDGLQPSNLMSKGVEAQSQKVEKGRNESSRMECRKWYILLQCCPREDVQKKKVDLYKRPEKQ